MKLKTWLTGAVMVLFLMGGTTAFAQVQNCVPDEEPSIEEVAPGVFLTWDSSLLCENAPEEGAYDITVTITNDAESNADVVIDEVLLSHTTPRPRGQIPVATAVVEDSTLPANIAAGVDLELTVTGDYKLVMTDEGGKANLHLRALGWVLNDDQDPFSLGINVKLRGDGAVEEGDEAEEEEEDDGPPEWVVKGPPAFVNPMGRPDTAGPFVGPRGRR